MAGQPKGFTVRLFCLSLWIREEVELQGAGHVSPHAPKQVPENQENAWFAKFFF